MRSFRCWRSRAAGTHPRGWVRTCRRRSRRLSRTSSGSTASSAQTNVVAFQWAVATGQAEESLLYLRSVGDRFLLFRHDPGATWDDLLHDDADRIGFFQVGDEVQVYRPARHESGWRIEHWRATVSEARRAHWTLLTAYPMPASSASSVDALPDGRVRYVREGGRVCLLVERKGQAPCEVAFAEPVYEIRPALSQSRRPSSAFGYRFILDSLTIPPVCHELDPSSGRTRVVLASRVRGFDPSRYVTRNLRVRSADGTEVPVSLAYRGPLEPRRRPVLIEAYGALGLPAPVGFRAANLSLLDRGVVLAVAHVRGGGDLAEEWHRAGRGRGKEKSIEDVIAVAEQLRSSGIAAPGRVAARGGSSGGFLIAAAAGRRPELFQTLVLDLPVLDLLSFLERDARGAALQEWGDPAVAADYRWLRELCPTANLAPRNHPAMLIHAAWHDRRVPWWCAARYVARLRAVKTDGNPVLLLTSWNGGHAGPSRRSDRIREDALQCAFLLHRFGISE